MRDEPPERDGLRPVGDGRPPASWSTGGINHSCHHSRRRPTDGDAVSLVAAAAAATNPHTGHVSPTSNETHRWFRVPPRPLLVSRKPHQGLSGGSREGEAARVAWRRIWAQCSKVMIVRTQKGPRKGGRGRGRSNEGHGCWKRGMKVRQITL